MVEIRPESADDRVDGVDRTPPFVEDPGPGLEALADVARQRRPVQVQPPRAVVADVEDGAAALVGVVVPPQGAGDTLLVVVAVGVDRTAGTAALGAGALGVGAVTDRPVLREDAV